MFFSNKIIKNQWGDFTDIIALICSIFFASLKMGGNMTFLPPLSKEEERECFEKMKNGDGKARAKLIEHNLRLVAHIVKKYCANCDQDDLLSIGTIGLIKAVDTFNPDNGTRFATYASKCLQNEIFMYFRSQKRTNTEVSINDPIDTDKNGNPLTYIDIFSTEDNICETIDVKIKCSKALRAVCENLSEREREIICKRYGLFGNIPKTQREIAAELNISRSYVSRIEKNALQKIEKALT